MTSLRTETVEFATFDVVAELQVMQSEVAHLNRRIFNTHSRIRIVSETIRNSIQDTRLKIQHFERYYQWVQVRISEYFSQFLKSGLWL